MAKPTATRARNLATHTVFGVGPHLAALVLAAVWPTEAVGDPRVSLLFEDGGRRKLSAPGPS